MWTTNWAGEPDDLLVHRMNLSPLFVRLALTTYSSGTNGQFAVNGSSLNLVPRTNSIEGFFLKGSTLHLYSGPPARTVDSAQVLTEDRSFVYEAGLWRDSVVGRVIYGAGDPVFLLRPLSHRPHHSSLPSSFTRI